MQYDVMNKHLLSVSVKCRRELSWVDLTNRRRAHTTSNFASQEFWRGSFIDSCNTRKCGCDGNVGHNIR